jgi:hypothetical protein
MGEVMRAYPVEGLLDPINDMVNGTPVVVLPTTTGAAVFSPQLDDATLVLERHAEGFTDTEMGSIWTGAGFAVAGPLEGTALEPLATRTTFWIALIVPGDRDLRVSTTINVVTIWLFLAELRGCP